MIYLYKTIILIIAALVGGLLYSFTVHLLISAQSFSSDQLDSNIGYIMTQKAVYVWLSSCLIGAITLFIQKKWQYILLSSPLFTPSVFALFYALS